MTLDRIIVTVGRAIQRNDGPSPTAGEPERRIVAEFLERLGTDHERIPDADIEAVGKALACLGDGDCRPAYKRMHGRAIELLTEAKAARERARRDDMRFNRPPELPEADQALERARSQAQLCGISPKEQEAA